MNSVYQINKGVGKPIVFKGLKGQWIGWLCGGLLMLLLVFALCYISGVSLSVCVAFVAIAGALLFYIVYNYNNKYGEYGLLKEIATRVTPKRIVCDKLFCQ
ncbi:MAG: DUF4133 domain-containing protein [Bacteroidota bacterium]